jgi:DNA-binding NarL/FixJ family response regulator
MYKALIADDHPLFRAALRQAITSLFEAGIEEVGDFNATLNILEKMDFDIVFLDLHMPHHQGLEGVLKIRQHFPNTLCVIVSAEESLDIVHKAMQLGASGFIPKSSDLDTIATATQHILLGEDWIPAHLPHTSVLNDTMQNFAQRLATLTPTQIIVLEYMSAGLLNKQIAYQLAISESTVKHHSSAVLKKLGLNNRTQAGVLYKQFMEIPEPSLS